eukprot:5576867-Amphidinium_carterae.5
MKHVMSCLNGQLPGIPSCLRSERPSRNWVTCFPSHAVMNLLLEASQFRLVPKGCSQKATRWFASPTG